MDLILKSIQSPLQPHPKYFLRDTCQIADPVGHMVCKIECASLKGAIVLMTPMTPMAPMAPNNGHRGMYLDHVRACIRQGYSYKVIKTVAMCDHKALLRELIISALVDTIPIDGFYTIVWYYLAMKYGKYELYMHDFEFVIKYAYDLALCQHINITDITVINFYNLRKIHPSVYSLSYSLEFVKTLTGKWGSDLASTCNLWISRTQCNSNWLTYLSRPSSGLRMSMPTEPLVKDEWVTIGLKVPNMAICYLLDLYESETESEITKAISWYSSITTKRPLHAPSPHSSYKRFCKDIQRYMSIMLFKL